MKLNSNFILEILNIFIWIYTFILCITLSIMIFVFFATLFGIDIGSMKEMTINLDIANEKIKDIQSLGKGKSLLILAYAVISGTLELIMFTSVIKILKKLKSNQFFSVEIYLLISKIAKLALIIGCLSVLMSFVIQLASRNFSISLDSHNENFQFFLFAGVVYIIAQVYKKAVDLQSENDLTI